MNDFPYLIAIGCIEQGGKRLMPIGGKALKKPFSKDESPGTIGKDLALEILLRIFQRSDQIPLRRQIGEESFFLVQMSLKTMQDKLPILKKNWIESGDFKELLLKLKKHSQAVWSIYFVKYEGIIIKSKL